MIFTPGVIEPSMSDKFRGMETNRFQSGWGDFGLMIEALENALKERPWLPGEQFTAADADRCLERPAYQTALAVEGD